MLDGTDVDAQINKKRAHKTIMAEAFSSVTTKRLNLKKGKNSKRDKKPAADAKEKAGSTSFAQQEPPDSGYEHLICDDGEHNGYIIEDGNIIAIDQPHLDALNKYAYDVIKAQVMEHV